MRAAEFIQKLVKMVDAMEKQSVAPQPAPPQQIVININGGTASVNDNAIKPSGEPVVDPADRKGSDGKTKWTPPLQQHLDTVKTSVATQDQPNDEVISTNPVMPGR